MPLIVAGSTFTVGNVVLKDCDVEIPVYPVVFVEDAHGVHHLVHHVARTA